MRLRRRYVPMVVLLAATAALPAIASSETSPTVNAVSSGNYVGFAWSPEQAAIASGGTVTFANSSPYLHGIHWSGGPATPTCSGVPVERSEANWQGACTFAQPGTYTYYCTVHGPEMHGTIVVSESGVVTSTGPQTPPATTGPATAPPPSESPPAGPAGPALELSRAQRGASVRGSLEISQAGAGSRLEVDVLASNASLRRGPHRGRTRVGRLTRGSVQAGAASFVVRLDAEARRALARRGHLTLTVKVALTPLYGAATTYTRTVVERG